MPSTTLPTNQDLSAAIEAMETRLNARIDELDNKIDGAKAALLSSLASKADLGGAEERLKAEIAGSYELHEQHIMRLEAAVGE